MPPLGAILARLCRCGRTLHDLLHDPNPEESIRRGLTEDGLDPNQVVDGIMPLTYAVMLGSSVRVLELLVTHGANVNRSNALHLAAAQGHLESVQFLIKHKADVDQAIAGKYTPLRYAKSFNRQEVVRALVDAGATR